MPGNRYLNYIIIDKLHDCEYLLQLIYTEPLHFDDFIVTLALIEWVASFTEVVQNITWVQHWYPCTVMPRNAQILL